MENKIREKGLTVIEMLVVIAIIVIISSMGLFIFNTYQASIDLTGSARELVSDLRLAQQLSISEQTRHGVQFLKSERKYQIIRYGDTEEVLKEKELPATISYQSISGLSGDRVRFNPYGASEEDGSVVLINTENNTKTIQIKPSGFVKIY
jgi:prepilin-type N-terminal cleavage/methylation domain-containing protein